jgi:hypothetical protein
VSRSPERPRRPAARLVRPRLSSRARAWSPSSEGAPAAMAAASHSVRSMSRWRTMTGSSSLAPDLEHPAIGPVQESPRRGSLAVFGAAAARGCASVRSLIDVRRRSE